MLLLWQGGAMARRARRHFEIFLEICQVQCLRNRLWDAFEVSSPILNFLALNDYGSVLLQHGL